MQIDSPTKYFKLRPIFIKRICYIAFGFSTLIAILAFSTPSNYQQASLMYLTLSLILSLLVKYEKFSLATDFFIIGFTIILILAAYTQKSAYVFSGTTILITIAAFLKSVKYVTSLFVSVLGVVFLFIALGTFTLQQTIVPGYNMGLVNNAIVMLVILTLSYPEALFIQKVLIGKLVTSKESLVETEGRFRLLFEQSRVPIEIYDAQGKLIEVNQACLSLFGVVDPIELKGFNLFDDPNVSPEVKALLLEGQPVEYEVLFDFEKVKTAQLYQTKRSGTINLQVQITPLKNEKTQCSDKYLVYIEDATARKQSLQFLQESKASLQMAYEDALQVSEMKTNLLSFASHELKTPLVPIVGWVGFIKKLLETGKKLDDFIGKEEIESMVTACERLDKSVSKFLDIGRIESKRLVLQVQDHSLIKLFASSMETVTQLARSRGTIIHSDVLDLDIQVDGFRLEEVFINILSNAIKYSPPDSQVWVTTLVDGETLIMKFKDEGLGFTPDQLKLVWRPFSASLVQNKSEGKLGTGIGLFLSKGIVEQHGGTIKIESPGPSKGSTVTISLPLKQMKENND